MLSINATVTDKASPALAALISALTGQEMTQLNEVGGRAATQAASAYHREFDNAGGWRGARSTGSGGSSFGAAVAMGWHFLVADESGALIYNDADHYAFKVRGGTILPKRVKYLTIPLIPEAKGVRAEVYEQNTGNELFVIPGRNALFERTSKGSSQGESLARRATGRRKGGGSMRLRRRSGIRAVYALVRSVTQAAMPDAVPPMDMLSDAFVDAWQNSLIERISRATS